MGWPYGYDHSTVGAPVPTFVSRIWEPKRLEFVKVEHDHLTAWLRDLRIAVENARAKRIGDHPAVAVSLYLKGAALLALGEALHDYRAVQQRYLDQIHMMDYGWFTEPWDKSLYANLRSTVIRAAAHAHASDGRKAAFLYVAPGPHAPLFGDAGASRDLRRHIDNLHVLDILSSVVFSAAATLALVLPRGMTLGKSIVDVTGGCGDALCNVLSEIVDKSATVDELHAAMKEPEELLERILPEESIQQVAASVAQAMAAAGVKDTFDISYSEMVASFMATPPVMAFRSAIFGKYDVSGNDAASAQRNAVLDRAMQLWQRFNDRAFALHVAVLCQATTPGGLILIATDTEKRFDPPTGGKIDSFSSDEPWVPDWVEVDRNHRFENTFMWRDHAVGFDVRVAGEPIRDFLSHEHVVWVYAFQRHHA